MMLPLWKEFRDNRLLLGATAWLILAVLWILGFWDQGTFLREEDADLAAATVAGWITWMFLTCSLFGSEWHRSHAAWLARTPWGLARAWIHKVLFATLASLMMSLWAWGHTRLVVAAMGITPSQARYELLVNIEAVWLLGLLGTWWIAASCWRLRPGFVLFVAPALAIGWNAPYMGALLGKHWSFPPPTGWDLARSAALALVIGFLAFTGYRPQRPMRIVGWTLCLAFVGHSPALWAWAERYQRGSDLDFATGSYTIEAPLVSPNGRYLYFTSQPPLSEQDVRFWVAVDLARGEAQRLGQGQGYLTWANDRTYANFGRATATAVQTPWAAMGLSPEQRWVADTAEVGGTVSHEVPHFDAEAFQAKYPNLWQHQRFHIIAPVGFGFRMAMQPNPWFEETQRMWVYDPFLHELVAWENPRYDICAVLRGGWLLRESQHLDHGLFWYDPSTRKISQAPSLKPEDVYVATTAEDEVLLCRNTKLLRHNFATAETSPLEEVGKLGRDWAEGSPAWCRARKLFGESPVGSDGRAWLVFHVDQRSIQIGRYENQHKRVIWSDLLPREFEPIEVLPNGQVLGVTHRQNPHIDGRYGKSYVQTLDWDTGELQTLFPRTSPEPRRLER